MHARLYRPLCSSRTGARESGIGNWCRELGDRPPPCLKRPARARFVSSRVGVALINLQRRRLLIRNFAVGTRWRTCREQKFPYLFFDQSLSVQYGTHVENLSAGGYVYASIICSAQQFRPYDRQGPRYDEAGLQGAESDLTGSTCRGRPDIKQRPHKHKLCLFLSPRSFHSSPPSFSHGLVFCDRSSEFKMSCRMRPNI